MNNLTWTVSVLASRGLRRGVGGIAMLLLTAALPAAALPAPGEWDGVTASARLDRPYEDLKQIGPAFGFNSYFNQPWRCYMDTWPARRFGEVAGAGWTVPAKDAEAVCQVLAETGIRTVRIEIGWGSLDWDDAFSEKRSADTQKLLATFKAHGIRPMILLNSHHGVPCPNRPVWVELAAAAKKGDRVLKLKNPPPIHAGYTGPSHPDYIAAYPLITRVDADGTAHLSAGLGKDTPAGRLALIELKYQPFQGVRRKDGTPVPEAMETVQGWLRYAAAVGNLARAVLGTPTDSGFDIEVWNEQTFGANFLDINKYYAEKIEFSEPLTYRKTRPLRDGLRPDARTQFEQKDCYAILPMTIDAFNDPANGFHGVKVVSGFANQWPWDSGTALWDGQAGFSRHYYTGGCQECSPEKPFNNKKIAVVDALGNFEGKRAAWDWHTVAPGSFFVPTFRVGCPESTHMGFRTEFMTRDVIPDSRWSGMGQPLRDRHGRYTHNGDFRPAEVWETEVNYGRSAFCDNVMKASGVKPDDPRLLALSQRLAGKTLFRQYLFHNHKGLRRIYLFALRDNPLSLGMLPASFFAALDQSGGMLTAEARALLPPEFEGMAWLTRAMAQGEPLDAPRPLRVDALVEYKPRLVFAGDGTAAHPHQWNRDWFAFLPYQVSAQAFVIPYYVMTLDMTHVWDASKDALDPARYDMPEQEFDVTIGNCAGEGATVSAYDPLSHANVPVRVIAATPSTLTVRVKVVDYPRILQVAEARPGPQILDPAVTADRDGQLSVSWRANFKPDAASVTWGCDWTNRATNEVAVAEQGMVGAMRIPTHTNGVLAVRIRLVANGLTNVWPRWDEDPAGQVVVPGTPAAPVVATATKPVVAAASAAPAVLLASAPDFQLPVLVTLEPRAVALRLPAGASVTGAGDERETTLGSGDSAVRLRVRFVPGGGKAVQELFPVVAVGDVERRQAVTLPSGLAATVADYQFLPAAHPGMTSFWQRDLVAPVGVDDAVVVTASGSAAAGQVYDRLVTAIFASLIRTHR